MNAWDEFLRALKQRGSYSLLLEHLVEHIGPIPRFLCQQMHVFAEVFVLSEMQSPMAGVIQQIWNHSLRTAYLAALISEGQGNPTAVSWHAFVGGLLHDIGLLIPLIRHPRYFWEVVESARTRGMALSLVEQQYYGVSHAQLGAALLSRWGFGKEIVTVVEFHDEPYRCPKMGFSPVSAVFLANLLDGGGVAQDSDGVLSTEGEAYLFRLGLFEQIPYWRGRMVDVQKVSIR